MDSPEAERNLLFGILALRMDFLDTRALVQALKVWMGEGLRPLEGILLEGGQLSDKACQAVRLAVEAHLAEVVDGPPEGGEGLLGEYLLYHFREDDPFSDEFSDFVEAVDASRDAAAVKEGGEGERQASSRYQLKEIHDDGGIGDVFRAFDREVHRTVALKRLKHRHCSEQAMKARFLAEGQITGNLEHPGIVPVYGLGKDRLGRPFFAMRFIRGRNLRLEASEFHRQKDALAPDDSGLAFRKLLRRFIEVCNTIEYAHHRRVIHRDIKPENIMVGRFGETLVVDWGLAKLLGKGADDAGSSFVDPKEIEKFPDTQQGTRAGTIEFMSPEQARGEIESLGPKTDIYSLGATLYFILTGRGPFGGFTDLLDPPQTEWQTKALSRVEKGEFPRPREVDFRVPAPLEAICLTAMEGEAAKRYASSRDLGEAIERWLAEEPVAANRLEVERYRKLIEADPHLVDYSEGLGRALNQLGLIYSGMGRVREAEAALKEAIEAYRNAVQQQDWKPRHHADLAYCLTSLARFHLALGRQREAEEARREAADIYRRLIEAYPQVEKYRTAFKTSLFAPVGEGQYRDLAEFPLASGESQAAVSPKMDETILSATSDTPPLPFSVGERAEAPGMEVPTTTIDRFSIESVLGLGGMGTVYRARDRILGRKVALKMVTLGMAGLEAVRARLFREASVLARLEHPGIPQIYHCGVEGEYPFIAMRLVEGSPLERRIEEYHQGGRKPSDLRALLRAFVDACRAIAFANSRGVIHRDPKPSNIVIETSGKGVVIDWGTCKLVDEKARLELLGEAGNKSLTWTNEGEVFGTPAYMSPEQAMGELGEIDALTDVFVLGSTLFCILTNASPWASQLEFGINSVLKMVREAEPPHPRDRISSVDGDLDGICARAMARRKEDRFPSAEHLANAVECWLWRQPIAGFPRRLLERPLLGILQWLRKDVVG